MFGKLFNRRPRPVASLPRLSTPERAAAIYAIGDVHGCMAQLQLLQSLIEADAAAIEGEKLIVMLGDYIDRGPDSSHVLDFLLQPPPAGFQRVCLRGNHEAMLLDYLDNPARQNWLQYGGVETLASYGIDIQEFAGASQHLRRQILEAYFPAEHVAFLRRLPVMLSVPDLLFVHAGIRPGVPLDRQDDQDLMWIREEFHLGIEKIDDMPLIVHGHTPATEPVQTARRICVDTAAYASGALTAVRFLRYGAPIFIKGALSMPIN